MLVHLVSSKLKAGTSLEESIEKRIDVPATGSITDPETGTFTLTREGKVGIVDPTKHVPVTKQKEVVIDVVSVAAGPSSVVTTSILRTNQTLLQ